MRKHEVRATTDVIVDGEMFHAGALVAVIECDCPGSMASLFRSGQVAVTAVGKTDKKPGKSGK